MRNPKCTMKPHGKARRRPEQRGNQLSCNYFSTSCLLARDVLFFALIIDGGTPSLPRQSTAGTPSLPPNSETPPLHQQNQSWKPESL
jgi:hypothetical protein